MLRKLYKLYSSKVNSPDNIMKRLEKENPVWADSDFFRLDTAAGINSVVISLKR